MKKTLIYTLILIIMIILTSICAGCGLPGDPIDEAYFDNLYSNEIYLGDAQLLIPAYGELYLTAFASVYCEDANTFYKVIGPSTTGEILGFEDDGQCRLTYTDITAGRTALINTAMTVSLAPAARPAIISAQIFKNGVADLASLVGDYIGVDDVAESLPITCLIELEPGDYMEIYISSNTANKTVVVNTLTLIAITED